MPVVGSLELIRDFVPWFRSQGASSMAQARPWLTFEATRHLERQLPDGARVLEYGGGGSTLYLARHGARIVTVEHDREWFERLRASLARQPSVELVLAEPRRPINDAEAAVASTAPEFVGQTFIDYVAVADRFPDHHFDVLLVDGRARPSAFFRGEPKVRVGGLVILDDSERAAYRSVMDAAAAAGWVARGAYGPKPFVPWFARTTVWTKTRDLAGAGRPAR